MRVWPFALAVVAAVLVPTASASAQVLNPPRVEGQSNSTSTNWAGYAATGGSFQSVSASWTQPAVTCAPGETSYSSFWVGLDGYSSNTVEQIGTDSDCVRGTPTYYAWYEMYPKKSIQLALTLSAGAAISATVQAGHNGAFTLTLTAGGSPPVIIDAAGQHAALSSAEVITEAPSSNHGRSGGLGLADFGTVTFTNATVDGAALASFNPDPITMEQGSTVKAQPSSISGGTFMVTVPPA